MIEYRIRPVTRYVVTRYEEQETASGACRAGCETRGEFDNPTTAHAVAYALCKAEHDASGEPVDSMGFIYPEPVSERDHVSDCATHDAPAYSPGPCTCGATD